MKRLRPSGSVANGGKGLGVGFGVGAGGSVAPEPDARQVVVQVDGAARYVREGVLRAVAVAPERIESRKATPF